MFYRFERDQEVSNNLFILWEVHVNCRKAHDRTDIIKVFILLYKKYPKVYNFNGNICFFFYFIDIVFLLI